MTAALGRAAGMAALGAALLARTTAAGAQEIERPPLPEALLTESATDIDAERAGELEWEANAATVRARSGGARASLTSVEVEWRALRDVGLRLEPSYVRSFGRAPDAGHDRFGVGGVIALGLFHDFARDLHLQAEIQARTPEGGAQVFAPGESELPVAADLLGAARFHRWTLRATAGGEAGGAWAHAPLHTDLALLTGVVPDARFGFLVLEARADWARRAPLVVAAEVVADLTPLRLPFRLGVALPVNIAADAASPSYGLFVRVILLTSREVEYGSRTSR